MKSTTRKAAAVAGATLAPKVIELAPSMTSTVLHRVLSMAISGVGAMPGAVAAAERDLQEAGTKEKAVKSLIRVHVAYAGAEGFVTNLGGIIAAVVSIPANIAGLAFVQCRMLAGIAHLRGYDLDDPRVRNAILMLMLGESTVSTKVLTQRLPGSPLAVATAPAYDPALDQIVAGEVAAEMLARITGKRLAATVAKKTPVIGGVVGASVDSWETYQVGRYARRELLPRKAA